MAEIAARLAPLERKTAPVDVSTAEARDMHWATPRLVAEIRYAEITEDGRLRHASFEGLRADKQPEDVKREHSVPIQMERDVSSEDRTGKGCKGKAKRDSDTIGLIQSGERIEIAGITLSSPARRVFPNADHTKKEVAEYYAQAADRMLAFVAGRPVSLLRLPEGLEGQSFFQKHAGKGFPETIRRIPIEEKNGSTADYMMVRDAAGLVGAVQMGTIEFHIWGARADRLDRPDRMVFDLDPDEGMGFDIVREAALEIRDKLQALGLPSWALLSGGKGVHVVVPLRRTAGWETVTLFSRTFAQLCSRDAPDRYTATMSKARRKGRIFIDWLRNERGATAIAPWSLRARPGAPVAVPVSWDELGTLDRANAFGLRDALARAPDLVALPAPVSLNNRIVTRLEDAL
jgi:bifunctional non-homologous end joining protein LigD